MTSSDVTGSAQASADPVDTRLMLAGGCEEAAAVLGVAVSTGATLPFSVVRLLARVQNDLYDISARVRAVARGDDPPVELSDVYVDRVDRAVEHYEAMLAPAVVAALPGGTHTGASLHHARTVVFRAERAARAVGADPLIIRYLVALEVLVVVLARLANAEHGDTDWQPGLSGRLDEVELWEPLPEGWGP
ncbi:ATP:cob(I)alamin adenosyltransferase [Tomitella gaofuii]|uniref:ATP:cob(I)alamin adenosyltransferase n=1 Tax=Tomitella gaofuii TaxID=2760083 RepID=UPI0015FABBCD|nr:ATP:cob(I)alamin adenosyltransferase [Tomitella gaofuii]